MPWTGLLFLGGAVAICGLPPLNGFVSEWFIYLGLLHSAHATPSRAWYGALRGAGPGVDRGLGPGLFRQGLRRRLSRRCPTRGRPWPTRPRHHVGTDGHPARPLPADRSVPRLVVPLLLAGRSRWTAGWPLSAGSFTTLAPVSAVTGAAMLLLVLLRAQSAFSWCEGRRECLRPLPHGAVAIPFRLLACSTPPPPSPRCSSASSAGGCVPSGTEVKLVGSFAGCGGFFQPHPRHCSRRPGRCPFAGEPPRVCTRLRARLQHGITRHFTCCTPLLALFSSCWGLVVFLRG